MVMEKRPKKSLTRTVREGEPHQIDGVIVVVRRKRRHGGQYRVEVRKADDPINVPIDKRTSDPQ